MKKARKLMCCVLCMCMLFFSYGVQAADLDTGLLSQNGKVNYDLPTSGEDMLDKLSNATISLDTMSVDTENNEVSIQGSVQALEKIDFSLSGHIYRSRTFDNYLYMDADDQTGNFEVISLAYMQNAKENELFVAPNLQGESVVRLILLKTGTRELYLFELDAANCEEVFPNCIQFQNHYDSFPWCDESIDEVWWTKVFTPAVETVELPATRSGRVAGVSDSKKFTYRDGVGNSYIYNITIKATSSISGKSSSKGLDTFKFAVVGQTFTYNGHTTTTPYLRVYNLKCEASLIKSGTNPNKDYMVLAQWDYKGYKKTGGWSGSISVTFGKLINGSINFNQYKETKVDATSTNFSDRTNVQGVSIPCKGILRDVGDYFDVNITKEFVSSGNRISKAKYYYSLGFDQGDNFYKGFLLTYGTYS